MKTFEAASDREGRRALRAHVNAREKKAAELAAIRRAFEVVADDGHGVYRAEVLDGLPAGLTVGLVHRQGGGSHPKAKVYRDGVEVEPVGFHGLALLRRLSAYLGTPGSSALGRGFEARELSAQIREALR